jgi:hypothetical protein
MLLLAVRLIGRPMNPPYDDGIGLSLLAFRTQRRLLEAWDPLNSTKGLGWAAPIPLEIETG